MLRFEKLIPSDANGDGDGDAYFDITVIPLLTANPTLTGMARGTTVSTLTTGLTPGVIPTLMGMGTGTGTPVSTLTAVLMLTAIPTLTGTGAGTPV